MSLRLLSFLCIASTLALAPLPAHASTPRLAIVVRSTNTYSDKASAFVGRYLRELLRNDLRFEIVDVNPALGAIEIEEAAQAFGEASARVSKAKAQYEALELDGALQSLTSALEIYERNAAHLEPLSSTGEPPKRANISTVSNMLALLGAVHILRGEDKAGIERLVQAIGIYPESVPDPSIFNPQMRQTFTRAIEIARRKSNCKATVTTPSGFAEIYVDGVFRGITPGTVENLTEGRHYFRLSRDGYKSWGAVATLAPGREAQLSYTLRALPEYERFEGAVSTTLRDLRKMGKNDRSMGEEAEDLAKILQADQLFLVDVKYDGDQATLTSGHYALHDGERIRTAQHKFAYDTTVANLRREIGTLLMNQFGDRNTPLAPEIQEEDLGLSGPCLGLSCSFLRKVAFRSAIGGGILAATGATMFVLARRDNNAYKDAVQGSSEATELKSAGELKGLLGDIMIPVGVVLAIGSSVLLAVYQEDTPASAAGSTSTEPVNVSLGVLPGGALLSATMGF